MGPAQVFPGKIRFVSRPIFIFHFWVPVVQKTLVISSWISSCGAVKISFVMSQRRERKLSEFLWISCSSRRKWGNALFKKVPGYGGNGFPSMAARAVLAADELGSSLRVAPHLFPSSTFLGVTSVLAGNTGQTEDAAAPLPCLLGSAQPVTVQW